MAPVMSRVKQEQLRKRRNNLLRRHNEFWSLYGIRSWLIMEMPNRRLYTYHSHPNVPAPASEDMRARSQTAVHRTPADYTPNVSPGLVIPKPPAVRFPERQSELWNYLKECTGCDSVKGHVAGSPGMTTF
ncbi:hypothetical protein N7536_000067 [Penicillium majusculum]|nr:hypothetical protein N7536_000067 [Penicillium majusculum]